MSLFSTIARHHKSVAPCLCRAYSSFRFEDLQIQVTDKPRPKPEPKNLTFGAEFSDHMLEIDWSEKDGWGFPIIKPLAPFIMHPACKVFHYAPELFEGIKAYRCVDGTIRIFRPMENMSRMAATAARACLPDFDQGELLKCIKKLVSLDHEWVPHSEQCSLYIRPAAIGTEPTLGITMSNMAKIFVITGPVGAYYPTGLKPISLLADPSFVRAWPGGSGMYKLGSNYAPTIAIQRYALKNNNCQQVLWLYGEDHQMTEVGTMNLFVYWINEDGEEELLTPTLDSGLVLPGITRKSLLQITREWNEFKVSETEISMARFIKALNEGRVREVFGSGTACVVAPVNRILYKGQDLHIGTGSDQKSLAQKLYDTLTDIHYFRTPHKWMETLDTGLEEEKCSTTDQAGKF
ncbi:hypothetical protein EGW08_012239 [Elysia chlorotica]|uniref:Branched-chain-amino-acid aminotransferase n=1 Tax=Elysia chlorotica TaxID=188477 RepID=A0A3S1HIC0_ELYCH|nr:hypothetical protein EGW08_012239 [Elysia chlorotica]